MNRLNNKIRLGLAVLQLALFQVSLASHLFMPTHRQNVPSFELAAHDGATGAHTTRRPPRWPGRNKLNKGLGIREAAAVKPLSRVV